MSRCSLCVSARSLHSMHVAQIGAAGGACTTSWGRSSATTADPPCVNSIRHTYLRIPHSRVVGAPWIAVQTCKDANPATLLRASTLGASAAVLYTTTAEPCLSLSHSLASYARASRVPSLSVFVVRDARDASCVAQACLSAYKAHGMRAGCSRP